jgi:hypothetical protein
VAPVARAPWDSRQVGANSRCQHGINQLTPIDYCHVGWGDPTMDLVVFTHTASQRIEDVFPGFRDGKLVERAYNMPAT